MYTWMVSTTAYSRAWQRGNEYPKIRRYLLAMVFIQLFLLTILIAYNPLSGALIFLLPMITGIVLTVYATYFHHATLDTQDPYKASHNILQPWYNFLTGNLGYHTAHHIKGGLHWSKLPEFHKEIESKIESVYYKKWRLWISE
jgi:fatty acid desaturase